MIGKLFFVVLMALFCCAVVGSLLYGMAWLTNRSFLEVLGNLWIPSLFAFVGTIFSAFKIANEKDSA